MTDIVNIDFTKDECDKLYALIQIMIEPLQTSRKTAVIPKKKRELDEQITYMKNLQAKFDFTEE